METPKEPFFTKDRLKEIVDYVFREHPENKEKERKLQMKIYCTTRKSFINPFQGLFTNFCTNPDCYACQTHGKMFHEAIKKEVEKWTDATKEKGM